MADKNMPKLLEDLPGEKDEFGGHEQIANGILELIRHQEGGKNISLVGSWGSGKSTVVKFLKQKLEALRELEARVFIFDTWTSQTDPLRFSFLEQLISFLAPDKSSALRQECDQKLERFRFKVTHQTITNRPTIEPLSLVVLVLLLLWPVAFEDKAFFGGDPPSFLELVNIAIIFAPFLVAIGAAVIWTLTGKRQDKPLLSLFFHSELSIDQNTEARTYELSATEFQHFLHEILERSISGNKQKLIVVLDNIDRVDQAHTSEVWTALKAITETFQSGNGRWKKNVWIMVPYDKDTIVLPFERASTISTSKQESAGSKFEISRTEMRADFLEKTFQLEFSVPPPILSLKKEYFDKQLANALNISESDSQIIYRIFQFSNNNKDVTTPRKIKKFINDLVATLQIWGHKIDVRILALYNALRPQVHNPFSELLSSKLLPADLEIALGVENYRTQLASLFFGVDPSRANEILFSQAIGEAIMNCDYSKLENYVNMPGFDQAFETLAARVASAAAETNLTQCLDMDCCRFAGHRVKV